MEHQTNSLVKKNNGIVQLEFSHPRTLYESVASFKNDKEQQFIIRVIGCEQAVVEQYTRNLSAYLEVLPHQVQELPPTTNVLPEVMPKKTLFQEETINSQQNPNVTVALEVITKAQDIEQPQMLSFSLRHAVEHTEDELNPGEPPASYRYELGVEPTIKIKVDSGSVKATLVAVNSLGKESLIDQKTIPTGPEATLKKPSQVSSTAYCRLTVEIVSTDPTLYSVDGTVPVKKWLT
ncbi:MAG: hypothetical protein KME19_08445 [Microcoleus vaginatus WJT46-NPBG5]|jgi:hypothetical protein|nr:hypothetical protein [Microcoleus vaginatus WJT46-NPBG5]